MFDDADASVAYDGAWQQVTQLQPAHAGTIAVSEQKGAAAEIRFEAGGRVLLFSKLGPNCGKLAVRLDGGPPKTIDTYSADHVWGVCVYRQRLPATQAKHVLRVEVLAERGERSSGETVHLDGVRVEPE